MPLNRHILILLNVIHSSIFFTNELGRQQSVALVRAVTMAPATASASAAFIPCAAATRAGLVNPFCRFPIVLTFPPLLRRVCLLPVEISTLITFCL